MVYTKTDLDNLDVAIASGELSVNINGRNVTYRSIDELMKARRHVAALLEGRRGPTFGGAGFSVARFN